MIKNVVIGILAVLTISLGIYQYVLYNEYQDLDVKYTNAQKELDSLQVSNKLLQNELDTQKSILMEHTKEATKTYNAYKELLNNVDELENMYKEWFDSDIPFDFNELLNKTTDCDPVSGCPIRPTGDSTK